jgi:hypothetical protein
LKKLSRSQTFGFDMNRPGIAGGWLV